MWFSSKQDGRKRRAKGAMKFLRKGLLKRRTERTVIHQYGWRISADFFFLWVLFSGTLIYLAFFSAFFLIGEPRITGISAVPEQAIRESVEQQMAGKHLGIIPKNGFFVVWPHVLEERLRLEYPLLASAEVTRVFPDGMRVAVTEREKIILWCSAGRCLLIDEAGIAHENSQVMLSENMPYVLFIDDMSAAPIVIGKPILDPGYGEFAVRMSGAFPERLGVAIEPRYATSSRFADELRVKTAEGWEAYFGTDIPIESSLRTLKLLFEKELPQDKRAKLAYIDLRTENRAYYAFRGEEDGADK